MKLLILATLLVLLHQATGFDCYDCQNCEIPFNNQTSTVTCSSSVTQCTKVTARLGTVYTYVSKQCGPCSNITFKFGVTDVHVDCCTGNTCNGTDALAMSSVRVYVLLFFLCILNVLYLDDQ